MLIVTLQLAVAQLFSAFGCSILAYTASPRPDANSRKDHGYVIPGTGDPLGKIPSAWFSGDDKSSLHRFLSAGLDVLVLSLPLLPSTTNLISTEELQVLAENPSPKGKCFLVNIARGRIIDQAALVGALNKELLAGAALDVAVPEPLPQDSSLWDAKNVIITPHISALSSNYQSRAFDILLTNLQRRAKGEKMLCLVDRKKGY
jgi:phosphoglycerate dehydrogenase-like enzyme